MKSQRTISTRVTNNLTFRRLIRIIKEKKEFGAHSFLLFSIQQIFINRNFVGMQKKIY